MKVKKEKIIDMFLHIVIGSCRSGCRFMIVACFVMTVAAARYMQFCGERSEKQENGYADFWCDYSSLPMVWSLVTLSGQTTHLGTCYNRNNCTSPLAPDIKANLNSDDSYLSIRNIRRETAGTLQCSDGKETANCTLDVQSYAKVDACNIKVDTANWSAVGSCGVTNVYSAFERYEYDVYENDLLIFKRIRAVALTAYNSTTDRKNYFRGNYTHTWPLRHLDGNYTYKMIVYPSHYSRNNMGSIVIERPVPPSLQCELSSRESVGVPCVCSTPSVGRPAGRLLWLSRDTVLAAGQYGVTELHLYTTVDESGQPLTCQLDWIIKNNVSICIPAAAGRETILYIPLNVPAGADSALMLGVAVGGYVALGVVLAVVVVVGVVLWRRGMLRRRPSYDTATRERQLTEEEDGYTCLDMGEVASEVQRTGAAKADSDPDEIYENTTMGRPI